jgi:hypothetical protein
MITPRGYLGFDAESAEVKSPELARTTVYYEVKHTCNDS